MSLILKSEPGNFELHPITENPVLAVIVDITPLKEVERKDQKTGETYKRQVFRLVYESEVTNDAGKRFCVWSRQYSADGKDPLHEKSAFRADLKKILGRDITAEEKKGFEVDFLLGRVMKIMVDHEEIEGKVYSQLQLIKSPKDGDTFKDASGNPFKPSGGYIRIQDRKKDGDAGYQKAAEPGKSPATKPASTAPASAPEVDWENTKVHLEGYGNVAICDLDEEAIERLVVDELPKLQAKEKKLMADRRLITAIEKAKAEFGL